MTTPPSTPKPRRRTLKTQTDCRRALAWIFGELEAARLDVPRVRAMTHAVTSLSAILERCEMEAELEAIRHTLAVAGFTVGQ
jgi:hypothetical protein